MYWFAFITCYHLEVNSMPLYRDLLLYRSTNVDNFKGAIFVFKTKLLGASIDTPQVII